MKMTMALLLLPGAFALSAGEFDLTGQVLADEHVVSVVMTSAGGIRAEFPLESRGRWTAGDKVRFRGELRVSPKGQRFYKVRELEVLGPAPLPAAVEAKPGEVSLGGHAWKFVRTVGVIEDPIADAGDPIWNWFTLAGTDGSVRVAVMAGRLSLERLGELAGSKALISAIAVPYANCPGSPSCHLLLTDAAAVEVLTPPPWLTRARLIGVVVALVIVIIAVLIWNRSLKVLSERCGRRLYREELAHTKAELKVEERTRLAVELHDSLSQTLTGVALQIDAANGSVSGGNVYLENAQQMLASCRHELRGCLWDLRSRTFEEKDLTEAVNRTIRPHLAGAEAQVRFNVPRDVLSEFVIHAILRIVRELVVNAVRHGAASRLRVAGEYHEGVVSFSVKDDGRGFDVSAAEGPPTGHFGLQGIRERVAAMGGSFAIESSPSGTCAVVTLTAGEPEV